MTTPVKASSSTIQSRNVHGSYREHFFGPFTESRCQEQPIESFLIAINQILSDALLSSINQIAAPSISRPSIARKDLLANLEDEKSFYDADPPDAAREDNL